MKTGLLWFDDDPRKGLEEKVQRAATHYERKYGHAPDLCYVHPGVLSAALSADRQDRQVFDGNDKVKKVGQVAIRSRRSVLPHHFWLGMAEDKSRKSCTVEIR